MAIYIHQQAGWPSLEWDSTALAAPLAAVRHKQGRLLGRMEALGFALRDEAALRSLTTEAVETSEIEGERLDPEMVRSSLARRMGMDAGGLVSADRHVDGLAELLLDATRNHAAPLTQDRLLAWHAALFPTGRSGMAAIRVGQWRDDAKGPMQVVSGAIGRERVHFEAPPAARLADEVAALLDWFNDAPPLDPVLMAGVAHFWFVTIHPFDDGNGRIARAVADMMLARSEGSGQRFYSMSAQIRRERRAYYEALERAQKGGLDITGWLLWFLGCLDRAFEGADELLGSVLDKARFWEAHAQASLNERQKNMLNRLLDGFEGKLTSSKWAKLSKCSQDTALRDISDLVSQGLLVRDAAGGRSTSYQLNRERTG